MFKNDVGFISFSGGLLLFIAAGPCWVKYIDNAVAYSDWLGLDPAKYPISAAMTLAVLLQAAGIGLIAFALRPLRSPILFTLALVPASFLPSTIFIASLRYFG